MQHGELIIKAAAVVAESRVRARQDRTVNGNKKVFYHTISDPFNNGNYVALVVFFYEIARLNWSFTVWQVGSVLWAFTGAQS